MPVSHYPFSRIILTFRHGQIGEFVILLIALLRFKNLEALLKAPDLKLMLIHFRHCVVHSFAKSYNHSLNCFDKFNRFHRPDFHTAVFLRPNCVVDERRKSPNSERRRRLPNSKLRRPQMPPRGSSMMSRTSLKMLRTCSENTKPSEFNEIGLVWWIF